MAGGQPLVGEMDLGGLWRAVVARRRAILLPTLLLTAAAAVFVNVVSPRYAGEARVLLESRVSYLSRPDRGDRDGGSANAFDSEGVQSQIQVAMSNDLAREAIKRLKLIGNPEFDPSASAFNVLGRLMALFGLANDVTDKPVEDRVLKAYYDKLSVYPAGKSRVVAVEFSSKDPELAAKGADTIAELYLDAVASAKKDLARSAGAWLSPNIDDLRRRVREAEAKVEEFRGRNGLFVAGRDTTLPQQQLADASTQLTQSKTQRADAQAKAQILRDMIRSGRVFEISEVSNNELIRRLIEQRVTLRAQFALESRTLGSEHPRMKELSAQIADVEGQIRSAAERTVRGIENEAKVAAARVAQLSASLDEQKQRSTEVLENDVQLRALEREARTLRDQLESYLAKYREAVARDTDNAEPPDARIISRAVVPTSPAFPKKIPIILLTALSSLMICGMIVLARELMGAPAPTALAQSERSGWTRVAASPAPRAVATSEPVFSGPPPASAREALNLRIDALRKGRKCRCVAVIGADRTYSGKVVTDIAEDQADAGRVVLLTLSDAIAPIGDDDTGFTDLLCGDAGFAEAIRRVRRSDLHVIPHGLAAIADAFDDSSALDMVFAALAQTYRLIVIDVPFALPTGIRDALLEHVDQLAILCRSATPDESTVRLFHALRHADRPDPWVVLLDDEGEDVRSAA
ncbi:MAG: exopolysaccharide transport family protein [Beijerinckiaceae bacterium]